MSDELIDLCPICIENCSTHFTECNHSYCIGCLSRIKICAMCRNPLQRAKLYNEIKRKVTKVKDLVQLSEEERQTSYFSRVEPYERHEASNYNVNIYSFDLRPQDEDYVPSGSVNFSRMDNDTYSFALRPEDHVPSNTVDLRRMFNYNVLTEISPGVYEYRPINDLVNN